MGRRLMLAMMVPLLLGGLAGSLMAQDKRKPVKIEGKSVLPLRVLSRPFSNIYKEPDESKGTVEENVATFRPFYVYTRPKQKATQTDAKGWYEVGSDNWGTVLGWMKADDVFEWKQTMSLAYTHPEGRQPVLMFDNRDPLLGLVKAPSKERVQKVGELYVALDTGPPLPDVFPVRSVEPKKAIDITKQFYLLPILEFGGIEMENREGRILKLAAATAAGPGARDETDVRKSQAYLSEATQDVTAIGLEKLRALELDLVFVMDMTGSMQPYIDATLRVIKDIALVATRDSELKEGLHFGLWGYRDSKDEARLEFNTKNFTPALQPVADFEQTLKSVRAARVGSEDYPEDVFSGVDQAMRETQWREGSLRFLVLVGDAPSHGMEHPRNYSGQNETTLRAFADDNKLYIFALHIKNPDPRARPFHDIAEPQFRQLASNPGMEGLAAYYDVASNDLAGFQQKAKDIARAFVSLVSQAKKGHVAVPPPAVASAHAAGASSPAPSAATLAAKMGHAALVQWIGKETEAKAPRDITAWVVDKDLADPSIQSMDVRLLINKRQIDSLKTVLGEVIAAGRRGQIGGKDFFTVLQATAVTATRTPDQIKNAKSMADAGLVPEFLVGLPYKSKLMAMNNELWASWSNDEQDEFLTDLDAKVQLYTVIHDTPEGWIKLNEDDDPDEAVYPIQLEMLP